MVGSDSLNSVTTGSCGENTARNVRSNILAQIIMNIVNFTAKTQMIHMSVFAKTELKIMMLSPDQGLIADQNLVET